MAEIDVLFRAPDVQIGEFRCPPGDPLWGRENSIGAGWHVVFPGTGVVIRQTSRDPIVANPNHTVFYDDAQTYRRELLSDEGDRCVFLVATADFVRAVYLHLGDRGRAESERPRFATSNGPIDRASYLLHRRLVSHLRAGRVEELAVREVLFELVRRAVGTALGEPPGRGVRRTRRRRATLAQHGEAVDRVKRLLSARLVEPIRLDDLAAEVFVSPYHLSRIFREQTGWSIHGYLTELRLRSSLERLPRTSSIASLAAELGFSTHGHFTDVFRRRFGIAPSRLRAAATAREIAEMRTNLEAIAPPPA